jgi:hypothetical protein
MPLYSEFRESVQVITVANAEKETIVCDNCRTTLKQ